MRIVFVVGVACFFVGGCASFGAAAGGICIDLAFQVAGQVCIGILCDDDKPEVDPDPEVAAEELPPPPPEFDRDSAALDVGSVCRLDVDEGHALRLDCVDGTRALLLGDPEGPRGYAEQPGRTIEGDVVVSNAADVAALSGVFAITGSLRVESASLLRVTLASLRSVGGDLAIVKNPRLARAELPALVDVGGAIVIAENATLNSDPLPRVSHARRVDVVDNEVLPNATVDRLLALPPR